VTLEAPMRRLAAGLMVLAIPPCVMAGAVGGPKTLTVNVGYFQNNTQTLTVEFEGGREARVLVTGNVRGYSVVFNPDGKQFFGKLGPIDGSALFGIQGSWTPATTSRFHIQVINDDNDAKKDATFTIKTN
jgi:hypothetical protein